MSAEPNSKSNKRTGPDCFLGFCRLVNTITGISALLCLVAHGMAVAVGPSFNDPGATYLQIIRVYGMLIAAALAIVETEWQWLMGQAKLLDNWIFRGLCQAFLAILTLEMAKSPGSSDFDKSIHLYRSVAGLCMLSCAGFYFMGGILCIGALKQARYRHYMERVRVERDIETLDKQREELRSLLAVYVKE